uniref:Hypothetical chloroplast RF20 n=1 Tax=Entransia fimbriata TaxID=130991 RepID=A0A191T4U8_9VIRI|nr:hypothetical chloroplast RF20 [Entransia fimbriata]YP_009256723.1 hypothetical chloroplast RF20 [Entransia fimbriata]ANI25421.1 hypothetical chloroplast RF20 [Entransia fimbriata]ANI25427.1 hypothetical chloroplast RF20 [Entransia fimbriata]WKT05766.1 hypothetical chloroplast RF20 [Entransia fimbriata]WKT05767.1 hypothetical chloroplast RF20 [Entransia fimbriata]WKT05885.1 hypothetical chloroplast RF20 [Entransia fimbriata]
MLSFLFKSSLFASCKSKDPFIPKSTSKGTKGLLNTNTNVVRSIPSLMNKFQTRLQRLYNEVLYMFKFKTKDLGPLKILFVLLGFFQATALSTILGQTGDWDVLVSGALVALTEFLSFLFYTSMKLERDENARKAFQRFNPWSIPCFSHVTDFKNLDFDIFLDLINQWKIGLIYGLFVDSFKLGS